MTLPDDQPDDQIDRLLARGYPSGPKLDRLWRAIEPRVAASAPRQRRWLGFFALVPTLAAATWLLLPRPEAAWTARGGDSAMTARLESTCGVARQPACRVGEPIYLRVAHGDHAGVAYVALVDDDGARAIAGPIALDSGGTTAVTVKLIPETRDVGKGIRLVLVSSPALLRPDEIAQAASANDTLHLEVAR